jgi:hypothetical protein
MDRLHIIKRRCMNCRSYLMPNDTKSVIVTFDKMERNEKEAVVAYLNLLFRLSPGGTEESD